MYILNLYECDGRRYWPAGQYIFSTRKDAVSAMHQLTPPDHCAIVHDGDCIFAQQNIDASGAVRLRVGLRQQQA